MSRTMSLAIVTTATTSTFSQALALRESVRRWVPDVEVTIVASQQLARQIERVQPDAPLPSSGYSPLRGRNQTTGSSTSVNFARHRFLSAGFCRRVTRWRWRSPGCSGVG